MCLFRCQSALLAIGCFTFRTPGQVMLQIAGVAGLERSDLKDLRAPPGQPMLQFVAKRCFKSQRRRRSGFCASEKPAGGAGKAERRRKPGAGVKRSRAQNGAGVRKRREIWCRPVMRIESGGEVQTLPRLRPRSHDHFVGRRIRNLETMARVSESESVSVREILADPSTEAECTNSDGRCGSSAGIGAGV
jgi:hypothetical protein